MISAPLRPTRTRTTQTPPSKPAVKTHGHLALLEWDETVPALQVAPKPFGPKSRTMLDRCYDGGTLVLLAVSAGALAVSLARF